MTWRQVGTLGGRKSMGKQWAIRIGTLRKQKVSFTLCDISEGRTKGMNFTVCLVFVCSDFYGVLFMLSFMVLGV